jgi:hypothetical protein
LGEPIPGESTLQEFLAAAAALSVLSKFSPSLSGEPAELATAGVPPSANRANAPADNPEHAETLLVRVLRPDFPWRARESAVEDDACSA